MFLIDVFIANVARAGDSNAMKLEEDAAVFPQKYVRYVQSYLCKYINCACNTCKLALSLIGRSSFA